VGEDLRESGGLALLAGLAVTGVYIAWRFTGKFAAAATIALVHDVIVTVGAFAVFRWRFDLPSLAAILTVIGYSLNDTIVICDRIRENLRSMRKSTLIQVINRSLNQTLERTLIMSGTTLVVLLALLLVGGDELRGFSAALTVGVVVGTYSSIYIAAAYLVYAGLSAADLVIDMEGEPPP
jgi:preprotein translocase subunit SecF